MRTKMIEIEEEDRQKLLEMIATMSEREKIDFLFDAGYTQALIDIEFIDNAGVLIA